MFCLKLYAFTMFQGTWKLVVKKGVEAQLEAVSGAENHNDHDANDDDNDHDAREAIL